jgi:AcrR family transcriptional regulator
MSRQRLPAPERREQIAEAALHILATAGVHRMTSMELARTIGLSDASLFKHFANKQAIVAAAIDLFERYLAQSVEAARAEPDPWLRLQRFFLHRLALVRSHPDVLQLAFNDRLLEAGGPSEANRVRAIVGWSRQFIHDCLTAAQAAGQVRADLSADALVWVVSGVMRGAALSSPPALERSLGSAGADPEAAWQALWRLLSVNVCSQVAARNS